MPDAIGAPKRKVIGVDAGTPDVLPCGDTDMNTAPVAGDTLTELGPVSWSEPHATRRKGESRMA
jgi:hypothetical protein